MNKSHFIAILIASFALITGKISGQEAMVSAGGNGSGSGGDISYSIGQVFTTYSSSEQANITEGIQQIFRINLLFSGDYPDNSDIELNLYPNPTQEGVYLSVEDADELPLRYTLYQINGILLDSGELTGSLTKISLDAFESSVYLLQVSDDTSLIKTYQIIKK